jgi:hypothetical protein
MGLSCQFFARKTEHHICFVNVISFIAGLYSLVALLFVRRIAELFFVRPCFDC